MSGTIIKSPDSGKNSVRLGDEVPDFSADTTMGRIDFHQWLGGSWAMLFSHPADFTPVCSTEIGTVEKMKEEFAKRGVKMIAYGADPVEDHLAWIEDIKEWMDLDEISYPIIGDPSREIAVAYGMLDPEEKDSNGFPYTCRSVFIIGPDRRVKLSLQYPTTTGRNFNEVLRSIDSLQLAANQKLATPADWKAGGTCMVLPSVSTEQARKVFPKGVTVHSMKSGIEYIRTTPQPDM